MMNFNQELPCPAGKTAGNPGGQVHLQKDKMAFKSVLFYRNREATSFFEQVRCFSKYIILLFMKCRWASKHQRSAVDSLVRLIDLLKGIVWALLSSWITSGTGLQMMFRGLTMTSTLDFGVTLLDDNHLTFYAFC